MAEGLEPPILGGEETLILRRSRLLHGDGAE